MDIVAKDCKIPNMKEKTIKTGICELASAAKVASIGLAAVKTDVKNNALSEIAKALKARSGEIISANASDLAQGQKDNLAAPLLKRLKFDESKIADVIDGIESLIKLDDPVGETQSAIELDEGLERILAD